jgi:hypothetical protein
LGCGLGLLDDFYYSADDLLGIIRQGFEFLVIDNVGSMKQLQPVFCFIGLFQSNAQLIDEVCGTLRMDTFLDIGTNAGSAPQDLLRQHILLLTLGKMLVKLHYAYSKIEAQVLDYVVAVLDDHNRSL